MSCIGYGKSQHILLDRKCTPSLEQIKTNSLNRSLLAHQNKAMVQLHSSRIVYNIRYSQENNSSPEKLPQSNVENQVGIMKNTNNKSLHIVTYSPLQYPK